MIDITFITRRIILALDVLSDLVGATTFILVSGDENPSTQTPVSPNDGAIDATVGTDASMEEEGISSLDLIRLVPSVSDSRGK